MINIIVSNLLIIIIVAAACGWALMTIHAINPPQTFNRTILLSAKAQEAPTVELLLNNSSNILGNSLDGDKARHFISSTICRSLWQLNQTLLEAGEITADNIFPCPVLDENIKTRKNSRYGFNKSNQENNSKNSIQKQATPLLSNIKLVNSSDLSPSSFSSSPEITAASFRPPNSNFTVSSYFERVEMHESLMRSKNEKLLLHRNKRYLLFPEGSSFQLVFDLIIPIVDYTNFAIMGITCAVAWELPSKPPSEIIENFRTKLNDGTFGVSRRNDSELQSLVYINNQRTEQQPTEGKKRWREGVAGVHTHNLPQLSATTATTSGREHFLAYVPKPPSLQPSSSSSYNNYIQREKTQQPSPFYYDQQTQQQHNRDYEAFDTNQRKTLYANTNEKIPMYRNNFYPYANKRVYYNNLRPPANKWNFQNSQQKVHQQLQQANIFYGDKGGYLNKDNWWKRNENRIEQHWQKNQPIWWKYQQNPQVNFQQLLLSKKRTPRNRKILNKPPKHRIYPIFGKRRRRHSSGTYKIYSGNDDMTKELHDIHTKEHLQTRLKLYGKIEKLYKTRGQNGTACVLRALCETQRVHLNSYNDEPQTFIMELLRSIFALPKDILANSKESLLQVDDRYVNAVFQANDVTQTCSQQYNDCGYSITYNT